MGASLRKHQGIALLAVLLATMALTVILASLLQLSKNQAFEARDQQKRAMVRGLLESGVARAQNELAKKPDFSDDLLDQTVPGLEGSYSIYFKKGAAADLSVNNLAGTSSLDGPRGGKTVPPGSADVVVVANLGSKQERAEVLIGYGNDSLPFGVAAANQIRMIGDTRIDSYKSTGFSSKIKAGLHSNYQGPDTAISWTNVTKYESASVEGVVSTASTAVNAVDFKAEKNIEIQTGAGIRKLPGVDVVGLVSQGFADPNKALSDFNTPDGAILPAGNYTCDGNITITGDLDLDGCNIYVKGDLTVNGAIAGKGTVYVTGQTHFQGDQKVETNDSLSSLAICSQGSVTVDGYDSVGFLASNATLDADWKKASAILRDIQDMGDRWAAQGGVSSPGDKAQLLLWCQELSYSPVAGKKGGLLGNILNGLQALPTSAGRKKAQRKILSLYTMFDDTNSPNIYVHDFIERGSTRFLFPAIAKIGDMFDYEDANGRTHRVNVVARLLGFMDRLKLKTDGGRSKFTGIIYTDGAIYARNRIVITGALWAKGENPTKEGLFDAKGVAIKPGDVVLENGVDVSYDNKTAESFVRNLASEERSTRVQAWLKL